MISSIALKGMYDIGVNENNKFKMGDTTMSISDVPFVRYQFDSYDESQIEYIKKMMKKFNYSVHLYEIHNLSPEDIDGIETLEQEIPNLAKFLYIKVDDETVLNKKFTFSLDIVESVIDSCEINRIMLKDCSSTLDNVTATILRNQIAEATDFDIDDIGICGSPLSFGELCCLTAVKAREIAAEYSDNKDFPLPTANHQSMNCCGCIRYYTFENSVSAPAVKGSKSKTTKDKDGTDKVEKSVKQVKSKKFSTDLSFLNF